MVLHDQSEWCNQQESHSRPAPTIPQSAHLPAAESRSQDPQISDKNYKPNALRYVRVMALTRPNCELFPGRSRC